VTACPENVGNGQKESHGKLGQGEGSVDAAAWAWKRYSTAGRGRDAASVATELMLVMIDRAIKAGSFGTKTHAQKRREYRAVRADPPHLILLRAFPSPAADRGGSHVEETPCAYVMTLGSMRPVSSTRRDVVRAISISLESIISLESMPVFSLRKASTVLGLTYCSR
jgi:hypothetical protein